MLRNWKGCLERLSFCGAYHGSLKIERVIKKLESFGFCGMHHGWLDMEEMPRKVWLLWSSTWMAWYKRDTLRTFCVALKGMFRTVWLLWSSSRMAQDGRDD